MRPRAVLVLSIAALSACPARPVRLSEVTTATDDPAAEAAFRDAEAAFRDGDLVEARRRFEAFGRDHPRDPLVPSKELYLARIDLAEERPAEARTRLAPLRQSDDDALAEQATFVDGLALAALGPTYAVAALQTLEPFSGRLVDRADADALYRTLASLLERMGRPGEALRHFDGLLRVVEDSERSNVRARLRSLVASCPPDQAEVAYGSLPRDGEAWPVLAVRRVRDAVDSGDPAQARAIVEDLAAALGEEDLRVVEARELLVDREVVDSHVVGAVLPLSGRGRELGAAALRGLLVAAGTLDAREPGERGFRLAVRDDGGDAERAGRAVTDLVETDHVIAVVGPLESTTSEAAARAAERTGVPLLVLSPREGLTRIGENVFRAFLTPEMEAIALARHATGGLGLRRFGVVFVDAPYGASMSTAFAAAVGQIGGTVAVTRSYPPGTTSFRQIVAPFADAAPRLDAILVVDTPRGVGLVAPAMAAAGLWSRASGDSAPTGERAVQLLLPSLSFDPGLPRRVGRYLEGAVVSTGFFPDDARAPVSAFVEGYRERFGSDPGYVSAYAHDAFLRVRAAVESGARSRAALRDGLLAVTPPPGASALGGFTESREPATAVRLVRVVGETFRPVP